MDYGIESRRRERREQTEARYAATIDAVVRQLAERIRDVGGWIALSYSQLRASRVVNDATRAMGMFAMQEHTNLICKPSKGDLAGEAEIPPTAPLLYRWVAADEKRRLAWHAHVYRRLTGRRLAWLERAFAGAPPLNGCNAVLCACDYLFGHEADCGWVVLEPLKMAAYTGMPIDTLLATLDELRGRRCLSARRVAAGTRLRTVVRLCLTAEEFAAAESAPAGDVAVHTPKRRRRRAGNGNVSGLATATAIGSVVTLLSATGKPLPDATVALEIVGEEQHGAAASPAADDPARARLIEERDRYKRERDALLALLQKSAHDLDAALSKFGGTTP